VLAASSSHRLGSPKQLLPLPDGSSLVRRSAESVCASKAGRAAVVVGAKAERVSRCLEALPLDVVTNEDYEEGISHFAELGALRGDVGALAILKSARRVTLIAWPQGELDLDTVDDWERYRDSLLLASTRRRAMAQPLPFIGEPRPWLR
jgi:CTP:molybdopterin cytidylyltransferase MocA